MYVRCLHGAESAHIPHVRRHCQTRLPPPVRDLRIEFIPRNVQCVHNDADLTATFCPGIFPQYFPHKRTSIDRAASTSSIELNSSSGHDMTLFRYYRACLHTATLVWHEVAFRSTQAETRRVRTPQPPTSTPITAVAVSCFVDYTTVHHGHTSAPALPAHEDIGFAPRTLCGRQTGSRSTQTGG